MSRGLSGGGYPDALVVGPVKSGTTWIADYFGDRGDICLPRGVKETFFFDRHYKLGPDWYESHFRHFDQSIHLRTVEVAPTYFHQVAVIERIKDLVGSVPVIIMVRDPIERSWSHYLHMRRKGYTRSSLRDAIEEYPSIIEASRYSRLIPIWRTKMGAKNVITFSFSLLQRDPIEFARRLSLSLDLPFTPPLENRLKPSNSAAASPVFAVARTGRRISEYLRRHRLHSVVNFGKAISLDKVVYGKPSVGPKREDMVLSADDRTLLASKLCDEDCFEWKSSQDI